MRVRRRDVLALFGALAVRGRAQGRAPLFEVVVLDHINIRASNPTRTAHFYQRLFGGALLWMESIPPNPASPAAESWFLSLGQHFLSISPTFPDLQLAPGLDHICPAVRGYQGAGAAAAKLAERGIDTVSDNSGWIRDPDGMIYQFRNDANASHPAVLPGTPKASDTLAPGPAPFASVAIRAIALRVADLNKTAEFLATVFGGAMTSPVTRDARHVRFGDCLLRLIPRTRSGASSHVGMDRFAIAVKGFAAEWVRRALRQRGIEPHENGRPGEVHFADPDGIQVQLT